MRRLVLGVLLSAALAGPALADQASDQVSACAGNGVGPDAQIAACTWLLKSGLADQVGLATAYYDRGNAYAAKEDYDSAIRDYDQAARLDPSHAPTFRNRAAAHRYKREYDLAIQDYNEVIRLKPDDASAYHDRALSYGAKGDFDQAIRDFDKTIALQPGDSVAWANRGTAHRLKGDFDRAIQDYDQTIKLAPNDAIAFNNRGRAYGAKGDLSRAIQDYDQAILLKPDYAQARANRDRALAALAGSHAAAPVRTAPSTPPKPAERPSVAPKAAAAQPTPGLRKGNLAMEVLAKLEQTKEYAALRTYFDARSKADPNWPASAQGQGTADFLKILRADATHTRIVRTATGLGVEYAVHGQPVTDARIQVTDLDKDPDYRAFVTGAIASVIVSDGKLTTFLAGLNKAR